MMIKMSILFNIKFRGFLLPNRKMEKSSKPKISVIIPMYNEEKKGKKKFVQFKIRVCKI